MDSKLQDLIEMLEKAPVPNPELDARIYCAIHGLEFVSVNQSGIRHKPSPDGTHTMVTVTPYTGSLDSAVELVPDGWAWFVEWIGQPFSEGRARLWIPSQRTKGLKTEDVQSDAKNPAIALCSAALKARREMNSGEGPLMMESPMYLIWSNEHQAWWRANSCGYTMSVDEAGRYEREEALSIASG